MRLKRVGKVDYSGFELVESARYAVREAHDAQAKVERVLQELGALVGGEVEFGATFDRGGTVIGNISFMAFLSK